MTHTWHKNFNPQSFLAKIDVEKLILKNKAYPENEVTAIGSACFLCGQRHGAGFVLNDKKFLCKPCYQVVSLIEFPEKYEKLRRQYLTNCEAWTSAKNAMIADSLSLKIQNLCLTLLIPSVLLLFWKLPLVSIPILFYVISKVAGDTHADKLNGWHQAYPEPAKPQLRHFHDPSAELTARDEIILHVFNHWPGYPPFWKYLREIVLTRDGHRCQVTGCPSRLELHIHHKTPVAKGGAHTPDNLISLCDFHHALEPDTGHERIWAEIKTRYFTLVPHHTRANRANPGIHGVKAHLRRLKLVTETELKSIFNTYGLSCPHCRSEKLNIFVHEQENIVQAACSECEKSLEGPQELAEETGPRLAERLKVTKCQGQWIPRWDMLSERKKMAWGDWKGVKVSKQRKDYEQRMQVENTKPVCPKCGGPMRLIQPKAGQSWGQFWGCTQFRVTGCKGSAKYRANI